MLQVGRLLECHSSRCSYVAVVPWNGGVGRCGYGRGPVVAVEEAADQAEVVAPALKRTHAFRERRKKKPKWYWESETNRKAFLEALGRTFGVRAPADWQRVRRKDVVDHGGSGLLQRYDNSLTNALVDAFPENKELQKALDGEGMKKTKGYWDSAVNRQKFLEGVKKDFNITTPADWKNVAVTDVIQLGGRGLLDRYNGSLLRALLDADIELEEGVTERDFMHRMPRGHWNNMENRRKLLESVAEKHGVRSVEDWQKVRHADLLNAGAGALLVEKNGSVFELLKETFPEQFEGVTEEECRGRRAKNYWASRENRRALMDSIAQEFGITEKSHWKAVKANDLKDRGAGALLTKFSGSIFHLLKDTYPEQEWIGTECRQRAPKAHWDSKENRRIAVEEVEEKLGITERDEWRSVTPAILKEMGLGGILSEYGNSVFNMLQDVFPEREWPKFECRPVVKQDYWLSTNNVKLFISFTEKHLQLSDKSEWFRVSLDQLRTVPGGRSFLKSGISLSTALKLAYPEDDWTITDHMRVLKKSSQRHLRTRVSGLFPGREIVEDSHLPVMQVDKNKTQGPALELDIYLPHLKLAFEYNGEHHYNEVPVFGPIDDIIERDREKRELCEKHGIRLIEVPYWWDNSMESLAATVNERFPGLLQTSFEQTSEDLEQERQALLRILAMLDNGECLPIPIQPNTFKRKHHESSQLATLWNESIDPTGYLVAEKYDGSRVTWDGEGGLATRYGKKLIAPLWWIEQLPIGMELDGELWMGYDRYSDVVKAVARSGDLAPPSGIHVEEWEGMWRAIKFMAFDAPQYGAMPFKQRLSLIEELQQNEVFSVVRHWPCEGKDHLKRELSNVVHRGGEGLVLRDGEAAYKRGRTDAMLKVKLRSEAEVRMVKRADMKRGFIVEVPKTGLQQFISCSAQQYHEAIPAPGEVLTITYSGQWQRSGKFKRATFLRSRGDIEWEDVVRQAQ